MKKDRVTLGLGAASLAVFAAGVAGGVAFRSEQVARAERFPAHEDEPFSEAQEQTGKAGGLHSSPVLVEVLEGESNLLKRSRMLAQISAFAGVNQCRVLMEHLREDPYAVAQIATRWAELDPEGLFEFLENDGAGNPFARSEAVLTALYAVWARSDPEAAFAAALQTPSFTFRNRCVTELIGNLLLVDPEAAIEIAGRSIVAGDELLGQFGRFGDWVDADRQGAATLIMALPRSKFRMRLAADLCRRWGRDDPEAAISFAERLDPEARERGIESAVSGWMQRDLEAARHYLEAAGGSSTFRIGPQLASRIAERDPASAFAWIDTHLEGGARRTAIERAVTAGVSRHPSTVAAHVIDLPVGDLKRSAMRTTTRAWFESDASSAAEWLKSVEPGFAREAGLEGLRQARIPEATRAVLIEEIQTAPRDQD